MTSNTPPSPAPVGATLRNGQTIALNAIPTFSPDTFRTHVITQWQAGARLLCLFIRPEANQKWLTAVLADDTNAQLQVLAANVSAGRYRALTPDVPAAEHFENELAERWQITPEGHPRLQPERLSTAVDLTPERLAGEQLHEVAVGPVHAGIIEPGHFRFQCFGEHVFKLNIALGYQHRGIEARLTGGPDCRTLHYLETAAGDTTIGHSLAYCRAIEALAGITAPPRAAAIRAIMLELERIANHTGDLGAMAGDVAYLPTSSYCGRLRGDFLNLTALFCGNRFGRNLLTPGGVHYDLDDERRRTALTRFQQAFTSTVNAIGLMWNSASVLARFEGCGRLEPADALALGVVGVPARACGLTRDVRCDHPSGVFCFNQLPVSVGSGGDVLARAQVRWLEMQRSRDFLQEVLTTLPSSPLQTRPGRLQPEHLTVTLTEGWRGEICHVASSDHDGKLANYKIIDPSFHNWPALSRVMRDEQISNFPLCNKSFNLSYCGHDL